MYKPTISALIASACLVGTGTAAPSSPPDEIHLYIATTGSDTNPGTAPLPFRTIGRAARQAKPGTTVHVAAGIYHGNVTTSANGTPNARIRYVSDTKWGAKIIGTGTDFMWTNRGNYTDIVDFDVTGPGREGIINLASYTRIQGNHVHNLAVSGGCSGGGGAGINNANYSASDGDIIGNVVHDIGVPGQCGGVHGIYSANLRGKITNNIVYRASAWGIHLWHAANKVTIANNTVFSNGTKDMGGGIVVGAGDRPGGVIIDQTKVVNNIVVNNPKSSIVEFCYDGEDCTGRKNIFANNLVYGNGAPIALRRGRARGTIEADPQFVDFKADGSGTYRLKRSSPAIGAGTPSETATADIDNVPRPRRRAPDLGAYQHR